jgi:hypothetical protein
MTPVGYKLFHQVDLKKNQALFNVLSFLGSLIFIVSIVIGLMMMPTGDLETIDFWLLLEIFLGLAGYVILHEAIHVIAMKLFSKEKITIGFNWRHAFAGMKNAFFTRDQYAFIALAPSLFLGIMLFIGMIIFYGQLALYAFLLFIIAQNFAGSTGDFYVVYVLSQIQGRVLVHDDGLVMSYYIPLPTTSK